MAGKVKCSYEDCYKSFKSSELMIQHKIKDPAHEYCKRCDVDCEDDVAYLIHQMNNPKHIACCICGQEFKSEAGRDSHVELLHQRSQNLPCAGCGTIFPKAGSLMRHIENNECEVISAEVYHRRKAEKAIEKDAWTDALDCANLRSFLPSQAGAGSETETNGGGVSLLDDGPSHGHGANWDGGTTQSIGQSPLQPISNGGYTAPMPAIQSNGALSLDKFPSLAHRRETNPKSVVTEDSSNNTDLLSFDEAEVKITNLGGGKWHFKTTPSSLFAASRPTLPAPQGNGVSIPDTPSNASLALNPDQPISKFDRFSQLSATSSRLPSTAHRVPAALPPANTSSTARIRSVSSALSVKSTLDPWKYFDPLQNCFVCPGQQCQGKYATAKDFDEHLVSSAHVGGKTQCPSCLSKFNTTAALISHCESGSKKCTIRKSTNYNQVMRELTAGLLGTEGHLIDGSVRYVANKPEEWS